MNSYHLPSTTACFCTNFKRIQIEDPYFIITLAFNVPVISLTLPAYLHCIFFFILHSTLPTALKNGTGGQAALVEEEGNRKVAAAARAQAVLNQTKGRGGAVEEAAGQAAAAPPPPPPLYCMSGVG